MRELEKTKRKEQGMSDCFMRFHITLDHFSHTHTASHDMSGRYWICACLSIINGGKKDTHQGSNFVLDSLTGTVFPHLMLSISIYSDANEISRRITSSLSEHDLMPEKHVLYVGDRPVSQSTTDRNDHRVFFLACAWLVLPT